MKKIAFRWMLVASIFFFVFPISSSVSAAVFGEDDRIRVADTAKDPYRSIVLVYHIRPGTTEYSWCSGAIINDSTILTAAHCLYDKPTNQYVTEVRIAAEVNNGSIEPYVRTTATRIEVPQAYKEIDQRDKKKRFHDYGIVKFPKGTFKNHYFFRLGSDGTEGSVVTIAGYPKDKLDNNKPTMWESQGQITYKQKLQTKGENIETALFQHKISTHQGMSGGPTYTKQEGDSNTFVIWGIISGHDDNWNYSCVLTQDVIDDIYSMSEESSS